MNKMIKTLQQLTLAAAVSAVAGGAVAATNPSTPTEGTSTGDFDITYIQGGKVRVWGLEDMSFTSLATPADKVRKVTICTYNNTTNEVNFRLSSAKNFTLTSGAGADPAKNIAYTVALANKNAGGPVVAADEWGEGGLASNQQGSFQYTSQSSGNGEQVACNGALQTTDLEVTLGTVTGDVSSGAYTDTVTVVIQPI